MSHSNPLSKLFLSVTAGILCSMPAAAQADNTLDIYPLPAVFSAQKDDLAVQNFLQQNRETLVEDFVGQVTKNFPNTVNGFSDRTKYKTFVSYVSIPRMAQNKFQRGKVTELFLPLTASIQLVNAATGEMLYSYPLTSVGKYQTTAENENSEQTQKTVDELYLQSYQSLMKEIVTKAAQEFRPFSIQAVVSDTYKGLYILDHGASAGIAKGDLLTDDTGNQLNVLYAGLNYSVAEKVLGKIQKNVPFTKFATMSISQLKKPKIAFINDLPDAKWYNIFSSAVGNGADFSLITVDKTFYDMQEALVSLNSEFKSENMNRRTLPDYFLRLHVGKPVYTRYATNTDYGFLDKYNQTACGDIFDKTGNVVFATCTQENISDKTISDIKFTDASRFEVLTKNILVKLAEAFTNQLKFKQGTLPITQSKDGIIYVNDANGILGLGNTVTVFRKIKTEQKGEEIVIPIWEYQVYDYQDGKAVCQAVTPLVEGIEKVSKKDTVLAGALGRSNTQSHQIQYTVDKPTFPGNEVELANFPEISCAALASAFPLPVSISQESLADIATELNSGYGFKQKIKFTSAKEPYLLQTAYKIVLKNEKKAKNSLKREYNITVGIMLKNGDELVNRKGLAQDVHLQIPLEKNERIIQYELANYTQALLEQLAKTF